MILATSSVKRTHPAETHFRANGERQVVQAVDHATKLYQEAQRANERRVLVLAGTRKQTYETTHAVLEALPVGIRDTVVLSREASWACETIEPERSAEIMGRTVDLLVLDLHDATIPNAIGRATGAVNGGGILVLLCPDLEAWASQRDAFDEMLVVAPHVLEDVTGHFKRTLVETLLSHPGIGIIDVDADERTTSGVTEAPERGPPSRSFGPPPIHAFPDAAYRSCQSSDQVRILSVLEGLLDQGQSVVVSAERGRGKSSVAGIAAASLLEHGHQITVTAPEVEHVHTLLERAEAVLEVMGHEPERRDTRYPVIATSAGEIRYCPPEDILDPQGVDVLLIDEAAGIPVPTLESFLACDRIAFFSTLFGYEGSGQGFATRFLDRLAASRHHVETHDMTTPIRYAANDPIESWLNRALLLDARAVDDRAIETATTSSVRYHRWDAEELPDHPHVLRQMIGLLATAHYRTEPNDVARILDAPNLEVATLDHEGSVVAVALLAREGGLTSAERDRAYRGDRLRGNMLPDIFINEFRDPEPAGRAGVRIVRIATHEALRRRGLGSQLLADMREDIGDACAWIGAGFGLTAELVKFWQENEFVPIFIGERRNRASGAHSVVMLDGTDPDLRDRYSASLPARLRGSLSDAHRDLDPGAVLAVFHAIESNTALTISSASWRGLVAASFGPGRYDLDPEPARRLVVHHLVTGTHRELLTDRQAYLLIRKILQGHPWDRVTDDMAYPSIGQTRRAVGEALQPLVDHYGGSIVGEERERVER